MARFGITAVGAYVPRLRIERSAIAAAHAWMAPGLKGLGKGERAFCGWDEDSITMAVEAARACLGPERDAIASLTLASTTFPFDDLQNSAIVASALRLPQTLAASDVGHSQRAGTSALLRSLRLGEETLIIASDRPVATPASSFELTFGAGAAALRLGSEGVIANLLGGASITDPFVDHFRIAGARYDFYWEERWIREQGYLKLIPAAVRAALQDARLEIGDISQLVVGLPMRGAADAVARKIAFGGTVADNLDGRCGHTGTAHPLLMLASVLETARPGDRVLVVGFGQGADALVLEVTDAVEAARPNSVSRALGDGIKTDSYNRMLSFYGGIDLEWGMRAEKSGKTPLTEQYRSTEQIAGFVAGKCGSCGAVQFPQLQYCAIPECNAPASGFTAEPLEDVPFQVMTQTADWLAYYPAPPLHVGFVQFENGARLIMETVDVGPEGVDVGTPLKAVFRVKERDRERGYHRYFWKAAPIGAGKVLAGG
jgi:3-hydroxy-3-methylglutaryl CoA synthase